MDAKTFHQLPPAAIAQLMQKDGPKVCAFPINGTRRWFSLEYPSPPPHQFAATYLEAIITGHLAQYRQMFDHGITILLTPALSLAHLARGEGYLQMAVKGLAQLTSHPDFLHFYDTYQVNVRFYGAYRQVLANTPHAYLVDLFDELSQKTAEYTHHKLFFGIFAHDTSEAVAELTLQHYLAHGQKPDKRTLVKLYYGEDVPPVDLFIGFSKFNIFDIPLLATNQTDLYFMVAPSLYLSRFQLREILYDHLFTRRAEPITDEETQQDWMMRFYRVNQEKTFGVGYTESPDKFTWYPFTNLVIPTQEAS